MRRLLARLALVGLKWLLTLERGNARPGPSAVALQLLIGGRHTPYLLTALLSRYHELFVVRGCANSVVMFLFSVRRIYDFRVSFVAAPPPGMILFSSGADSRPRNRARTYLIDFDYYDAQKNHARGVFMPFYLHPNIYRSTLYRRVVEMRSKPRTIRVVFDGSLNDSYERIRRYSILTRNEIVDAVLDNFPRDSVEVTNRKHLDLARRSGEHSIVIAATYNSRNTLKKHLLDQHEYLDFVAESDFFLCAPGLIPHSHNIVEAMSVGTVPILNYGHLFQPPLTDGLHGFFFSTTADLVSVIRRVLAMTEAEINDMRRHAAEFYDTKLSPSAWVQQLSASFETGPESLFILDSRQLPQATSIS